MVLKMVTFRLKTCIVSAVSKISSMTSSPNEPSKPNSPQAASDADKPTRPMRKPRVINQNLTSVEFMPQVPAALSHSIDKESNDEVKID